MRPTATFSAGAALMLLGFFGSGWFAWAELIVGFLLVFGVLCRITRVTS